MQRSVAGYRRPHVAPSRLTAASSSSATTLYDVPVSNHGARVRFVIYKKKLEDRYEIKSPGSLEGGLKGAAYLALNPQGKMPLLVAPGGQEIIPESEIIVQYLLDKHADGACWRITML